LLSSRFNNPSSFIEPFVKRPALLIVAGAIKATQDSKRSIVVKETAPSLRLRRVKGGKVKEKRRNGEKKAMRRGDVDECQVGRFQLSQLGAPGPVLSKVFFFTFLSSSTLLPSLAFIHRRGREGGLPQARNVKRVRSHDNKSSDGNIGRWN
jgi:hypothetical protein